MSVNTDTFKILPWQILLATVGLLRDAAAMPGENPETVLDASHIGVIVNDAEDHSKQVANYYRKKRSIPPENIIHVNFHPGRSTMSRSEFQRIKLQVDKAAPAHVQAFALAWTRPYRVDCMSITTAFAAGFDESFCSKACAPTRYSPYFISDSRRPQDDHGMRPAMMLAGRNFNEVRKLIDRGTAADGTFPRADGYLVSTSDRNRNVRAVTYADILRRSRNKPLNLQVVEADFIQNKQRVLFYFTGVKQVKALGTIRFVPGAVADHLTSAGGRLTESGDQMSSLRWLEAGATGSYGAVMEPCNYASKFPRPDIVIDRYMKGETLIEAYWKSVAWPGEGLFIGEPLAAPYAVRSR